MNADYWIKQLNLVQHPEGGYYRETYRSDDIIKPPARFNGPRSASTAIYYLLDDTSISAFHKISSDEIWHFYDGDALTIYVINPQGQLTSYNLGHPLHHKDTAQLQICIKANQWFAAKVKSPGQFTLIGCTVAPGFDFTDFELADRKRLLTQYPQHQDIITQLTK